MEIATDQRVEAMEAYEYFAIIDMDRTLLKTNKLVPYLYQVFSLSEDEQTIEAEAEESKRGTGYDLFEALRKKYIDRIERTDDETEGDMIERRITELVRASGEALLYDGAQELFEALEAAGVPYTIMTKGGEIWQRCKLAVVREKLVRLDLPAVIVPEESADKAQFISEAWHDPEEGVFRIPEEFHGREVSIRSRHVIVLDDKAQNVIGTHPNVYGILVKNQPEAPTRETSPNPHTDGTRLGSIATMLAREGPEAVIREMTYTEQRY